LRKYKLLGLGRMFSVVSNVLFSLLSCAVRRTYALDTADHASMKVVLAGNTFFFNIMHFLVYG